MIKKIKVAFFILFLGLSWRGYAGSSLEFNCQYANGIRLVDQYITKVNYIARKENGVDINQLNILYNERWYGTNSSAIPGYQSIIQLSMTLNKKMSICVSKTEGIDKLLLGMEFSDAFNK